jgi:AhpD family alkylhydroperoxidase
VIYKTTPLRERRELMEPRLKSAMNSDLIAATQHLHKAIAAGGVGRRLLLLVHLRASQINGCAPCVYASIAGAKKAGETDERLHNVVAWRETPFFTDEERAALALTGAATRIQDGAAGVTDEIRINHTPPGRLRLRWSLP